MNHRSYWADGYGTVPEYPTTNPVHLRQEAALAEALRRVPDITSVIEVGCGDGRIAALLHRELPQAAYAGLDISPERLERTKLVRPDAELFCAAIQDFQTDRTWDLALTVEVLMHIPPEEIGEVVDKLKRLARYVIAVEWVPEVMPETVDSHNWPHDYPSLLRPFYAARTDKQLVYVAR